MVVVQIVIAVKKVLDVVQHQKKQKATNDLVLYALNIFKMFAYSFVHFNFNLYFKIN